MIRVFGVALSLVVGLVLTHLSGCVGSQTTRCGPFRCAASEECDAIHQICITPQQRLLCEGRPDGELCEVDGVRGFHCDAQVCIPGICGDGVIDAHEECDDGPTNGDTAADACRTSCSLPGCGDGVLDSGEQCDDGNNVGGDGCSRDCRSDETCGNGVVDVFLGEQCDCGAVDACSSFGFAGPYTGCQDGSPFEDITADASHVGQGNDRSWEVPIGFSFTFFGQSYTMARLSTNGVLSFGGITADFQSGCLPADPAGGGTPFIAPLWDDLDSSNSPEQGIYHRTDGTAGDQRFIAQWVTERAGGSNPVRFQVVLHEATGNVEMRYQSVAFGDPAADWGATATVGISAGGAGEYLERSCNQPILTAGMVLTFDTGAPPVLPSGCVAANGLRADACRADTCLLPYCGDGIADSIEECDDGAANGNGPDACRADCRAARCGDAVIDTGEVCDDGNLVAGDGCTPDCLSQEICGNGYVDGVTGELCDDGNFQSRDGCSSATCRPELAAWREIVSGEQPAGRILHSMAYDARRGRTVLFGGEDDNGQIDGTWEWDGVRWRQLDPPVSPGSRSFSAMAYDSARGRVVLFGGGTSDLLGPAYDDTWEWDGTTWHAQSLAESPPRRARHALVYDAARGVTVLFGGFGPAGRFNDTWVWDGTRWIDVTPATRPATRDSHAMAYDPVRERTVLFSGYSGFSLYPDTWEWDGQSWVDVTPGTGSPPSRYLHSMAYDATRGRVVVAAGLGGSVLSDLWEWDGTAWTARAPATTGLPARAEFAMAYDIAHSRLVLFGGRFLLNAPFQETWEWDGGDWRRRALPATPPPRAWPVMAYQASRGTTIVFGGRDSAELDTGTALADTWEWDGGSWTQHAVSGPTARSLSAMVYDGARDVLVLFGGGSTVGSQDTWEWDGSAWTARTPTTLPPARLGHSMAYDAARARVVLFGGTADTFSSASYSDTWEWDGTDWTLLTPAQAPSGRRLAGMAYDAARARTVLFGGVAGDLRSNPTIHGDTWEWDGTDWTLLTPAQMPDGRFGHQLGYDTRRGRVMLFGGISGGLIGNVWAGDTWEWDGTNWRTVAAAPPSQRGGFGLTYDARHAHLLLFGGGTGGEAPPFASGATVVADVWTFGFESASPEETCTAPDGDGDGRFGCADPDCAASCTPVCPPGAPCDPANVRCGDGVCQPIESCRTCPADCDACAPVCGDLWCDVGEDAASCAHDCGSCGDGIRQAHEACDDGNLTAGDGCSPQCALEP